MGISTRNSDINLRKQAKMIKQKKDAGIIWNRKKKDNTRKAYSKTCGNKSESAGERRKIKDIDKGENNTDKAGYSQTMKENSINNWKEMTTTYTNNRMQKKPNDFGLKYGNQKNIMKRLNG